MPESAAFTNQRDVAPHTAESAQASFREIYEEHFAFVWRFAAMRGVPQAALDDVVQEVFVVVHRKLLRFEGRSALRTWIAGITRNAVRSYLRKRGNQSPGEPLENEDSFASDDIGPVEALEHKTASELLDVILAKMSDLQREAFTLCEIEGLSAVETAEALEINEHTLRTRLHDARKVFNAISARVSAQHTWSWRRRSQP
jgi:RNA polymerase sigma-70 factor (ECF subfamily)